MNKKDLSERDICSKFINPAIKKAGWDMRREVREEVSFTDGRIIVQGKLYTRGKSKRVDYILYHKPNVPIAIIKAKDNKFLRSGAFLNQLFKTETGTANQGNLGSTAFKSLAFPFPPLEEQKAIVQKVNALMGLCDALEQEVQQS
ncbi:restriction endonuclease subunit S [Gelidibacter pelagius]|uniref:Restriction endonuclease subunit S n=1 Tax=Gelidibacter pelagius TaxID=2819985 RepID=A0ABS3SQ86_9FLAO|nr:restriction endonuclease subunit S [Gelidibacter pelagius]MBO3097854.1 restriction endonuclease subunit S [Gelidibacter pelagius]